MNYRQSLLAASLLLGLAGCASYSSSYQSDVVYRDGSYYLPADEGYGDYYYAPEPRDDYYDYYGQDFFYGGGYCSVRYSYCPPFWYSQFLAPPFGYIITSGDNGWYDPWGGGFGYGYYYPSPYYYSGRRHGGHDRDHDGGRDHRSEPGGGITPGPGPSDTSGTPVADIGAADGSTSDPDQAPIRRFGGPRDPRLVDGAANAAERGQPLAWPRAGPPSAMPAAADAPPMRRRYPAPMPTRAQPQPPPRWLVPEPRRADPAPQSPRSESSDSTSGDDGRSYRRRHQGE